MEEQSLKNDDIDSQKVEKQIVRTESSSSDEYILVDSIEKNTPVLENHLISEDLIKDAMNSTAANINSPLDPNVVVGKSIFYDCLDEKSKSEEKLSDTDDGKYMWNYFFSNL